MCLISNADKVYASPTRLSTHQPSIIGIYPLSIIINNIPQGTYPVTLVGPVNKVGVAPQLTLKELQQWGVKTTMIKNFTQHSIKSVSNDLSYFIPHSSSKLDFLHHKLYLTIPSELVRKNAHKLIVKYWNNGIPAILFDYNFSGSQKWLNNKGRYDSYFLSQSSGFNIGAWRFRDSNTWSYIHNHLGVSHLDHGNMTFYLQRNLPWIQSDLTIGEAYTPSNIFDGVMLNGIQLNSDDKMLSDSEQGFAPTIRGVASSYAKVTVKQNGDVVYQTYVPPGPFTLNDLYASSKGGNLEVIITESDGSQHRFTQPFSSVPIMQRAGRTKYALIVGQYYPNIGRKDALLGEGTLIYGLPHGVTLYGGLQKSENYLALAEGIGTTLGKLGAFSSDTTQEKTLWLNGSHHSGQHVRVQYLKYFPQFGSQFTISGDYYSHSGFYNFQEAANRLSSITDNNDDKIGFKHRRLQFTLQQNLLEPSWGSLSLSGYSQDYWQQRGDERNLTVGYSNAWKTIKWSVIYSFTTNTIIQYSHNQQIGITLSLPLTGCVTDPQLSTSINTDLQGLTTYQLGMNGTGFADKSFSYAIQQGYSGTNRISGSVGTQYHANYSDFSAGYNYDKQSKQINYGIQGAVVVHKKGITFSHPIGDNMLAIGLVHVPNQKNIKILNSTKTQTDDNGYAIVPLLKPYRVDTIQLDPASCKQPMLNYAQAVIPTAGAVVPINFYPIKGSRAIFNIKYHNHPIPAGAQVTLETKNNIGKTATTLTGINGYIYMVGLPSSGALHVSWSANGHSVSCKTHYHLPKQHQNNTLDILVEQCV